MGIGVCGNVFTHSLHLLLLLNNLLLRTRLLSQRTINEIREGKIGIFMLDVVNFEVNGGRGGNGAVSFRREKFIPRGGPDGGDGGRGGDVVFIAANNISTLQEYSNTRTIQAPDGMKGRTKQRHGATGNDLIFYVPTGSIVWELTPQKHRVGVPVKDIAERGLRIADLDENGMVFIAARGGRGGRGNKRFAKSTRQTPMFAQNGMVGQQKHLQIELKLLADVGLVGLPNAGKSTLLSMWSQAHPKIGSYEFTTLEPNLGVVYRGYDSFVAADMPGLIEGASQGLGLGHEFLRHIERTKVLIHLVDMSREDPVQDIRIIQGELASSGHNLGKKPVILALNKIDNLDA
ncbi:MAG: GTPase ObgE, partial [Chloroflexota bacterium]|nr:GTPase ObgE [Chloroflexota bacterium]